MDAEGEDAEKARFINAILKVVACGSPAHAVAVLCSQVTCRALKEAATKQMCPAHVFCTCPATLPSEHLCMSKPADSLQLRLPCAAQ